MTAATATTWRERMVQFADTPSWLSGRGKGLGGSDVPVILGLSRWKGPLELWAEKCGLIESDDSDVPEHMMIGNAIESLLIELLSKDASVEIQHIENAIVRHATQEPWLFSPDGVATMPDGTEALVEVKNVTEYKLGDWKEGAPDQYVAQVQHGMEVMGLDVALIGALIGGNKFRWTTVERDPDWASSCAPCIDEFWERVMTGAPPDADGSESSARALARIHPRECKGDVLALDSTAMEIHQQLKLAQAAEKTAKAEAAALKNQLRALLGDSEYGVLPGDNGAYRWSTVKRNGYTVKPSEFRQLRFVKKVPN